MQTILSALDAGLCAIVIIAALEYLRRISPFEHPWLALSFYLVAIGAFGVIAETIKGESASIWSVILHGGIVMYAWVRRHSIFIGDWNWDGRDRRRHTR